MVFADDKTHRHGRNAVAQRIAGPAMGAVAGPAGVIAMRTIILALTVLVVGGCASTGPAKPAAPASKGGRTPVARSLPSLSQRKLQQRIREGRAVAGDIDVKGSLVR